MENSLWMAFLNLLMEQIWAIIFFFAAGISLARGRYKKTAVWLLGMGSAYVVNMSGFLSPILKPVQAGSITDISVVSVSVRSSNPQVGMLLAEMLKGGYDIVAVQELQDQKLMLDVLKNYPGYFCYYQPGKSTVVLSRFPAVESIHLKNVQRVTLQIDPDNTLQVYNLHAPKYSSNLALYNKFFAGVFQSIENNQQGKIVIAGDFNSTQNNYWRGKLPSLNFSSALHDAGSGWLATFPTKYRSYGFLFPFVSIDDIYVKNMKLISGDVLGKYYGSDHHPVHAMLRTKLD